MVVTALIYTPQDFLLFLKIFQLPSQYFHAFKVGRPADVKITQLTEPGMLILAGFMQFLAGISCMGYFSRSGHRG